MSKLKFLIVEDEPLVAEDIAGLVEELGYLPAHQAYSAEEALELLKSESFDFVMLDITLGGELDGIDVGEYIHLNLQIPFIYLTSHSDKTILDRAKKTFPSAYLLKPFNEPELTTTLEVAIYNHLNRPGNSGIQDIEKLNEQLPNALSQREFDILELIRKGSSNPEIAEQLHLSVNTIKTHLLRIYDKLDARNRTEALFKLEILQKGR